MSFLHKIVAWVRNLGHHRTHETGPVVETDEIIARVQGDVGADAHESMIAETRTTAALEPDADEAPADTEIHL